MCECVCVCRFPLHVFLFYCHLYAFGLYLDEALVVRDIFQIPPKKYGRIRKYCHMFGGMSAVILILALSHGQRLDYKSTRCHLKANGTHKHSFSGRYKQLQGCDSPTKSRC